MRPESEILRISMAKPLSGQRGLTLLEVLLSTVVLGIAVAGFLMALATANIIGHSAIDASQLVHLASREIETLRSAKFDDIPFMATSATDDLVEVPDYFRNLAISQKFGGDALIIASGDLSTPEADYSRDLAFDGKRANFNSRWMGNTNALAYVDTGGGPNVGGPGGGGGGPNVGGPGGGGPDVGGDFAPPDFQYIFCSFPRLTKISRILYDNRFNVTEIIGAPAGSFDRYSRIDDVWQRKFEFFYTDQILKYGELFDPWRHTTYVLDKAENLGYGSSDIYVVFDNADQPMEAGIIGLMGIDTYTDFDLGFHWPYASEIEVYGFNNATNYVPVYRFETTNDNGDVVENFNYDNVIMYFPNYMGSGFDLGRRVYCEAASETEAVTSRRDAIRVVLEFYPASNSNRDEQWQKYAWWRDDTSELAKFQTVFYRDEPTRVDQLPNLRDFPSHMVYDNNEDILFPYTVPGASEIRGRFSTFNLESTPGSDTVTIEDKDGNVYLGPVNGTALQNTVTPWIPGDTLVIHFRSDGAGNSYDSGYTGFEIASIEIKWVGVDSSTP